jgi:hypothetical protein
VRKTFALFQVTAVPQKKRGVIDSILKEFGFVNFKGIKLFFLTTEVQSSGNLYPGDAVEFFIITDPVSFDSKKFQYFTDNIYSLAYRKNREYIGRWKMARL